MSDTSTDKLFKLLRGFDTPTICNALEILDGRHRSGGFSTVPFVCALPDLAPVIGFARTATIRAREPAAEAGAAKRNRLAYYDYVAAPPQPSVVVLQDLDDRPGFGAFWGEVNTAIHQGLGVAGCVTNGSIRDLNLVAPQFQLLAGSVGPSHAHVHVEALDLPVVVHGLEVRPGDLVHADRHGAVVVPLDHVPALPDAIDLLIRREALILDAARAPGFTVERLRAILAQSEEIH